MFPGTNPWQSHAFPRSRPVLCEGAAGRWRVCLTAMLGVLMEEDLPGHRLMAGYVTGAEEVLAVLREIRIEVAG